MVNTNFFEMSQIIFDGKEIYYKKGTAGSVPFEFMDFWPLIKDKDFKNKSLVFIHNHPDNYGPEKSAVDDVCLKALNTGLGRSIHFIIFCKMNGKVKCKYYTYKSKGDLPEIWLDELVGRYYVCYNLYVAILKRRFYKRYNQLDKRKCSTI